MSLAPRDNRISYTFDINRLFHFYNDEYDCLITTGLYHRVELEQVKDIIHQLFLDFAEKKIDLDAVSNPRAYILTSFKRRLIDFHRIHARQRKKLDPFINVEFSELSVDRQIEENEGSAEIIQKLKAAYLKLPERCKKVIFLKFYEQLRNDEIMARTGLSARSVYNNLSEGLKILRSQLTNQHSSRIQGLKKVLSLF